MNENIETAKALLGLVDEILVEKNQQLDSLKSSLKAVEGYVVGTKELAASNENVFLQQKKEALELLAQQKLSHDNYHVVDSVLTNFHLANKSAALEAEKLLLGRQCEIAVLIQDIEKITQRRAQLVKTIEELTVKAAIEKRKERGVRPDQDPTTQAGRAAIDLMARKGKGKKDK